MFAKRFFLKTNSELKHLKLTYLGWRKIRVAPLKGNYYRPPQRCDIFSGVYDFCGLPIMASRWAPTSYKRSYYNPCEWPYKWVTGVFHPYKWSYNPTTGRGPSSRRGLFLIGNLMLKSWLVNLPPPNVPPQK